MKDRVETTSPREPAAPGQSALGSGAGTALDACARIALDRMLKGYRLTQCLYVAARLGIADVLLGAPARCADVAATVGADPGTLYRVLRVLAADGVFAQDDQGRFMLTPVAEWLRTDVDGSLRSAALAHAEVQWRPWGELLNTVRTGKPAFERVHDMGFFQYLAQHPEKAAWFQEAMTRSTSRAADALISAYDFTGGSTVVDVGGGHGALLAAALKAYPRMRGVLFDTPTVIGTARNFLGAQMLLDRCDAVAGDFFESVPAAGDIYILKGVLHDWNDEQAVAILKNCRRAAGAHGKILVVETLISPSTGQFDTWLNDLNLLVLLGGRERTEAEYQTLLTAAGLELRQVVRTDAPRGDSILESVPTAGQRAEDLCIEERGWL